MQRLELQHKDERIELSPPSIALGQVVRLGAGKILAYHRVTPQELQIRYKGDKTPVTVADEESEKLMVYLVKHLLPNARIYGEETGITENIDTSTTVYLDPLDGTNPFIHKERYSSVGLAVRKNGETVIAAICLPFTRELLIAEKGKGAWMYTLDENLGLTNKSEKLSVSTAHTVEKANIYLDASIYPANQRQKIAFIQALSDASSGEQFSLRMIGSNITQQAEVALGHGDATLTDCVGGPFDLFAGELLITEAGGRFTDLEGNPVTEQTQVALGSNGYLHETLLPVLREAYKEYRGFLG